MDNDRTMTANKYKDGYYSNDIHEYLDEIEKRIINLRLSINDILRDHIIGSNKFANFPSWESPEALHKIRRDSFFMELYCRALKGKLEDDTQTKKRN